LKRFINHGELLFQTNIPDCNVFFFPFSLPLSVNMLDLNRVQDSTNFVVLILHALMAI
jgi:hypothetical protein